jgi:hypothetical protein
MGKYASGIWAVAALLLVAGPLTAQDKAEAPPLRMIYAVWKDASGAGYAMSKMSKSAKDQVEAYAVLVKDDAGHVAVKERGNKAGGSDRAMQASMVIDTAVARLSAPPATAEDSAAGYAPNPNSRLSPEEFKKAYTMLGPGQSALLLLSPKPNVSELERSLGTGAQSNAQIMELEVKPESNE